jgi:hypothetical protein
MINRTICLPEELNEKLKKEENASALISQLIEKYYKLNVNKIDEIEERQKQIEEERKKFQEKYSEDYAVLENRKQIIKKEAETEEQVREKAKRMREEKINNILDYFQELTKREMTKEELSDYLFRLENEPKFNMWRFVEEKLK